MISASIHRCTYSRSKLIHLVYTGSHSGSNEPAVHAVRNLFNYQRFFPIQLSNTSFINFQFAITSIYVLRLICNNTLHRRFIKLFLNNFTHLVQPLNTSLEPFSKHIFNNGICFNRLSVRESFSNNTYSVITDIRIVVFFYKLRFFRNSLFNKIFHNRYLIFQHLIF